MEEFDKCLVKYNLQLSSKRAKMLLVKAYTVFLQILTVMTHDKIMYLIKAKTFHTTSF